jgi:hypothetical protein
MAKSYHGNVTEADGDHSTILSNIIETSIATTEQAQQHKRQDSKQQQLFESLRDKGTGLFENLKKKGLQLDKVAAKGRSR